MPSLPKTTNGKVDKKLIREQMLALNKVSVTTASSTLRHPEVPMLASCSGEPRSTVRGRGTDAMDSSELRRIARTLSAVENQAEGYEQHLSEAYRLSAGPT